MTGNLPGDDHKSASDGRVFNLALVGCGRIAKNHFDSIERIDGIRLSAVCDVVEERAREAGARLGVPYFKSVDEMLANAPADVVTLCTPSGLHPDHGIKVARAGKHVITEKPMAITLRAADELVSACDQAVRNSADRMMAIWPPGSGNGCKQRHDQNEGGTRRVDSHGGTPREWNESAPRVTDM